MVEEIGRKILIMAVAAVEVLLLGRNGDCSTVTAACYFGIWLEDTPLPLPPKKASQLDVVTLLKCAIILLQLGLFLSICFQVPFPAINNLVLNLPSVISV